jgi:UDP-2,4-diacetamido-2,4,6-trideoxy-beta-L-altropyranose hydrolase
MNQPMIVFRTEGGPAIGLGHIRRSMTLAQALQKQGARAMFVLPEDPVSLDILGREGFSTAMVARDKDLDLGETLKCMETASARAAVIDAYSVLDFSRITPVAFTGVIDDLADRSLPVNLIINGGADAGDLRYRPSPHTELLLGPKYSLLREEFSEEPVRRHKANIERVLITLGGTDPNALSVDLITWVRETFPRARLDVVIGAFLNPAMKDTIRRLIQDDSNVHQYENPPQMRELMLACEVAITGGGQTTYELAATGTPGLAIRLADNQTGGLGGLSAAGALRWIGDSTDANLKDKLISALRELAENTVKRVEMSRAGRQLVDGKGTRRVAQAILQACVA